MSLVGQEEGVVGGRSGEGPGGTHTMSRRATLPAVPAGGVGGMVGPPGPYQVLPRSTCKYRTNGIIL